MNLSSFFFKSFTIKNKKKTNKTYVNYFCSNYSKIRIICVNTQ